jgi:hypothetical protein
MFHSCYCLSTLTLLKQRPTPVSAEDPAQGHLQGDPTISCIARRFFVRSHPLIACIPLKRRRSYQTRAGGPPESEYSVAKAETLASGSRCKRIEPSKTIQRCAAVSAVGLQVTSLGQALRNREKPTESHPRREIEYALLPEPTSQDY